MSAVSLTDKQKQAWKNNKRAWYSKIADELESAATCYTMNQKKEHL